MFHQRLAPRFVTAAAVLLAILVGGASELRAQDAAVAPASVQNTLAPGGGESATGTVAANAAAAEAGPRVAPPLERYQANLPGHDRAEKPALAASGGSHTVVLSTLALVLIVVIVVLLAVD